MKDSQEHFSPLIERLMANASVEEKRAAQARHEHFVSILYRICDRLAREKQEARDKSGGCGTVNE